MSVTGLGLDRLLVLDDDPLFLRMLHRAGALHGFHVLTVSSLEDFTSVFSSFSPGLLVLDVCLAGASDFEKALDLLALRRFSGRLILATGLDFRALDRAARHARCRGLDVIGVVEKGRHLERLHALLAVGSTAPRSATAALLFESPEAVAESPR